MRSHGHDGGHTDPWDHVECAMALTAAGLIEPARRAFDWCRRQQRADGSWPIQLRAGVVEDANSDSNFCAYVAVGVWHHVLVTGDRSFATAMWPTVRAAIDFVLDLQLEGGEICWARSPSGPLAEALLTGCASIFHSIRCALALANLRRRTATRMGARARPAGPCDRRPSLGVHREAASLDGLVLPDPGWRAARSRGDGPDRRAVGRFRRRRSGHQVCRRPAVGDRRRDLRTGAGPRRDG